MGAPFHIRRDEVLRYLGHAGQTVDHELLDRIERTVARCEAELAPRWVWATYGLRSRADAGGPAYEVLGTSLVLGGASMRAYLDGAQSVALLACTLGPRCDGELRALGVRDPLGQLVYDAACTDLVELGADAAEDEVRDFGARRCLVCGMRYSPGYGDFPLTVQPLFLEVLQAPRLLGLHATPDCLLVPTKSVTAVVGMYPRETPGDRPTGSEHGRGLLGCEACSLREGCQIRARGLSCRRFERAERVPSASDTTHEKGAPNV